jgi:hypothetical protein
MALETTYIVTGKKQGRITFKFNLNGDLILFKYEGEPLDDKQRKWLYARLITNENQIKGWYAIKQFTVTKGEPDLSFDNFWNTYKQKQKRVNTEKLYKKLSDADKFNAIAGVKRYDNWLRLQRGMAKMLPDTYIRQKRWLDEF